MGVDNHRRGKTPQLGDRMVDEAGDNMPLIARVRIDDGKIVRFRFADIDFKALDAQLTPSRSRKQQVRERRGSFGPTISVEPVRLTRRRGA